MNNRANAFTGNYDAELKLKGFKVYETSSNDKGGHSYSRKDFFKISMTTGRFIFHYADKSLETHQTFLFFGNPRIPYSCEVVDAVHSGYTCLFTEDFLKAAERSKSLQQSPLFKVGGTPIFEINNQQKNFIASLFQKMIVEQASNYVFKDEVIRNYLQLIIHEAHKTEPSGSLVIKKNAAERITAVFLELLDRQFPIERVDSPLEIQTAQDFANQLFIHVNHLNSSVKKVTGKSTTTLIADRIVSEAKALLQHTDWSVAQIAYALGFEYPTYFNNFFKKKTGQVPKSVRTAKL